MLKLMKEINKNDIKKTKGKNFFQIRKNIFEMNRDLEAKINVEMSYQKCVSLGVFKDLKKLK
jgi:hypothetical protein